ncbi:gp436 family protein [Telmatospirillum sp. J64-1]|uniref:gp436 family protein n=1 Tax=Telmatospirillum sp. J64-1 TaxID=2502183 RepID=UPI00115CC199|nr:DUF1320 domain-containing protein [Telmatospirillum sp. J64-1]
MYATQQDMIDSFGEQRLIELTDRQHNGEIDTAVLDRALDDARQMIDGYLAARYRLPLSPVPGLVRQWACDIALYRLYQTPDEPAQARYRDVMRQLTDAGKGILALQGDGVQAATSGGGVVHAGPAGIFTGSGLEGF